MLWGVLGNIYLLQEKKIAIPFTFTNHPNMRETEMSKLKS